MYSKACVETFLKNQGQLFDEPVAETYEEAEEFLEECIECYRNKYGICKRVDNYVVYFIPQLSVMKLV